MIVIMIIIYKRIYKMNLDNYVNSYFDCYLNLEDIPKQFINTYKKYDQKIAKTGKCKNAKINIKVESCNTDKCNPSISILSSKGNTIEFPYPLTPNNLNNYFNFN